MSAPRSDAPAVPKDAPHSQPPPQQQTPEERPPQEEELLCTICHMPSCWRG